MVSSCFCLPLAMHTLQRYNVIMFSCKMFTRNQSWPRFCHAQSTSKLCFSHFQPAAQLSRFSPADFSVLERMPPIILHKNIFKTFSRAECIQRALYSMHRIAFSSWGVNNIKRASAGFHANTIIHSARCESTWCPRSRRKYCRVREGSQRVAKKKHFSPPN